MTLPLIYALNHATRSEKKRIIYIIKNKSNDKRKVREVIDFVMESGGIEYTRDKMFEFQEEALNLLHTFPLSDARTGLEQLIRFTTERRK